ITGSAPDGVVCPRLGDQAAAPRSLSKRRASMPVYPDQAYADTRDAEIAVHAITAGDVFNALRKGSADFWRHPSHYLFVALIYPVVGIVLAVWSAGGATFPLLYPLATGFALLGPIAALGL